MEVQEDPIETERTNEYAERVGGNYEVEKDDSEAERYQKKDVGEKDEVEEARTREGHEDGKVKRETVGAQEGLRREEGEMEKKKKKEDSPGDLRYETLIKIISSASVGCQGAYTTASRECNDLNGNNSVKDAERSRGEGGEKRISTRIEEIGPTSCTRRQEKNSRMDTSSRTKSVERPVRAVDLFIASLDALTLLEGSSTLSAQIDSDERATLLASFGRPRTNEKKKRDRFNEKVRVKKQEKIEEGENELADSSNTLHSSNEKDRMRRTKGRSSARVEGNERKIEQYSSRKNRGMPIDERESGSNRIIGAPGPRGPYQPSPSPSSRDHRHRRPRWVHLRFRRREKRDLREGDHPPRRTRTRGNRQKDRNNGNKRGKEGGKPVRKSSVCTVGASGTAFVWILGRLSCLIRYGLEIRPPRADSGKGPLVQSRYKVSLMKLTSRHRVKSGRAIISPLTAFEVYILSRHLQASRERRGQKRIRQKREGSACWIAEPRGVGARIKGAVRLEGAPNYDVTDRTRRDQVSRIQNGLLITESSSHPSDRHGGRHLLQPISASLYTLNLKSNICFLLKTWRHLKMQGKSSSQVIRFIVGIIKIPRVTSILEKHAPGEEKEKSEQRMLGWEGGKINGERSHQIH
ncbi:hypothetical protein ALC62_07689 [Cyphomyrmex costatus]|uniref:Uncharacterized protein n=1 Tax=Cyphomyrmex costatus TaxID=456900 RepID=A0A195CM12_9HYME|nr:hypothetical protein ALC62_07689 [Cyphomyrmex costatus]